MEIDKVLKKLPNSWDEITIEQFQNLSDCLITETEIHNEFDGIENSIEVISKLTGESIEDLEELPMKELNKLGSKISFMVTPPVPSKKTLLEWKTLDEITFNDFIVFLQVQKEPMKNLGKILKTFTKTELIEDDILQLPITEFISGFFLFKKTSKKFLNRSIRLIKMKIIWLKLKEVFKKKTKK